MQASKKIEASIIKEESGSDDEYNNYMTESKDSYRHNVHR